MTSAGGGRARPRLRPSVRPAQPQPGAPRGSPRAPAAPRERASDLPPRGQVVRGAGGGAEGGNSRRALPPLVLPSVGGRGTPWPPPAPHLLLGAVLRALFRVNYAAPRLASEPSQAPDMSTMRRPPREEAARGAVGVGVGVGGGAGAPRLLPGRRARRWASGGPQVCGPGRQEASHERLQDAATLRKTLAPDCNPETWLQRRQQQQHE